MLVFVLERKQVAVIEGLALCELCVALARWHVDRLLMLLCGSSRLVRLLFLFFLFHLFVVIISENKYLQLH